jgi:hypothetical protein
MKFEKSLGWRETTYCLLTLTWMQILYHGTWRKFQAVYKFGFWPARRFQLSSLQLNFLHNSISELCKYDRHQTFMTDTSSSMASPVTNPAHHLKTEEEQPPPPLLKLQMHFQSSGKPMKICGNAANPKCNGVLLIEPRNKLHNVNKTAFELYLDKLSCFRGGHSTVLARSTAGARAMRGPPRMRHNRIAFFPVTNSSSNALRKSTKS